MRSRRASWRKCLVMLTFCFSSADVNVQPRTTALSYNVTRDEASTEQIAPKLYYSLVPNVPAGKTVIVRITFATTLRFRGNSAHLYVPVAAFNLPETADSKLLKKLAKSWTAIVSCIVHLHMMSKIVSVTSSTDKIDPSLSAAKPREALVQFQRANPVSPIELVVTVADATVPTVYFAPLELGPHEQQGLHHAAVVCLGITVPKLDFAARPLPEVVFLMDVSDSMRDAPFKFLSKSLLDLLKRLPDDTPFNIVAFAKKPADLMWPKSQLKNKKTSAAATKWVAGLKPTGSETDVVGALQAVVQLPKFEGVDRQVVMLTDGHALPTLSEFEIYLNLAKSKEMRAFCVGYGSSSIRLCSRLSCVGRGTFVVAEAFETEKSFKTALDELMKCILQPPTVMTNLDLKGCSFMDVMLDRSQLDACFEGQRLNCFITLPPGVTQVSGKVALYLGEGAAQVDVEQALVRWDVQHPMSEVLRKLCSHHFMEELMQSRTVRNDRVARRKAQAEAHFIENRWTTNILPNASEADGKNYDTQMPGQVKHRGMPERSVGANVASVALPVHGDAVIGAPAIRNPMLQHVTKGPQGMQPGTWPRPQTSSGTADADFEARQVHMKKWRGGGSVSVALPDRDQLYRIEAEGMALDMALAYVATKIKMQPENFSRATVKLVQKAVSLTVAKFDEFFATRELAPIQELRDLTYRAVDELRFAGGQEKLSSLSDVESTYSSMAALVSCCGKVGGRSGGMEDRHICLPNFYTLMHLSTLGEDAFFCAVYDGHAGALCAEFCRLQLHLNMIRQHRNKEWPEAIRAAFFETDQQFREIARVRRLRDGTTATVLLIENSTLYHANVGDGEGFLRWKSGKIEPVTKAHKANDPSEIARMQEVEKRKEKRVLLNLGAGGMAVSDPEGNYMRVSRSIGDPSYDTDIVTCDPEVGKIQLSPEAEFVVIASDGIWDVIKFEEASEMLATLSAPSQVKAAEMLVDEAIRRGSMDNCSAIVVFLQKKRVVSGIVKQPSK